MSPEYCDVLIVGGGPAGSTCAWKLVRAGLDVLVLDKKPFPRDKPCAGWITPQVVTSLKLDLDQYGHQHVVQPIRGFRCGVIHGREVDADYGRTISYGIRRREFDDYLLARSGARLALGEAAESIERREGRWVVNEKYRAPLLIGAGGHFCPVARLLGNRDEGEAAVVAAQEVEFAATPQQLEACSVSEHVPELFFCQDLKGYGWCFRKGNYLNIGLGRLDKERLSSHVANFCRFLRERGKVRFDVPGKMVGHAYRVYQHTVPTLVGDGALLIGDAAGLAYPQSGEGIRPAVESGLLAADVILKAGGKYGRDELADYEARIVERLGRPQQSRQSGWLPASWLLFLASQLIPNRWFARHVIMDRWFLHSQQPALA
jgi:geranylgeranyl reductase family protein